MLMHHRLEQQSRHDAGTYTLSWQADAETQALQLSTSERCDSTPWLISHEVRTQEDSGFVEGGYLCLFL